MCLEKVKETYDVPCTLIMDGWKDFGGSQLHPTFSSYSLNGSNKVPLDKWIAASGEHIKNKEIKASDGHSYAPGFHVYSDEKEVKPEKNLGLRRVFVRKITCLGMQDKNSVIIAQEMYVPSNKNGWPPKDDEDGGILSRIAGMIPGSA